MTNQPTTPGRNVEQAIIFLHQRANVEGTHKAVVADYYAVANTIEQLQAERDALKAENKNILEGLDRYQNIISPDQE